MKLTFDEWKRAVDVALIKLCGMSADDLPDFDYSSAYANRANPTSTAKRAIRAARDY